MILIKYKIFFSLDILIRNFWIVGNCINNHDGELAWIEKTWNWI